MYDPYMNWDNPWGYTPDSSGNWFDSLSKWGEKIGKVGGVAGDIFKLYQGILSATGKDPMSEYVKYAKKAQEDQLRLYQQQFAQYLKQYEENKANQAASRQSFFG